MLGSRTAIAAALLIAGCHADRRHTADAGARPDGGARRDAGVKTPADAAAASRKDGASAPTTMVGAPCTGDADCGGGMCATSFFQFNAAVLAPGGYCTMSCTTSANCGANSACVSARFGPGHCSAGCRSDRDCRADYYCAALTTSADAGTADVTATCQPHPQTDHLADGVVGSRCASDADCSPGTCMLNEPITKSSYPGGYCSGSCVEAGDCGAHGVCAPGFFPGSLGSCSLGCSSDADCERDGYRCRDSGGVKFCAPGPKPLPDNIVGSACASDDDCGGGAMTCASAVGSRAAPGGYCTQRCAIDSDCGSGGTCIAPVDTVLLSSGSCYRFCKPPGGCREGYACRSFSGAAGDQRGVCTPEDTDDAGAR
jgi:hypothetical protein